MGTESKEKQKSLITKRNLKGKNQKGKQKKNMMERS